MTVPLPSPYGVPIEVALPTWCVTCSIHRATSTTPLCPVCLDKKKRGEQ